MGRVCGMTVMKAFAMERRESRRAPAVWLFVKCVVEGCVVACVVCVSMRSGHDEMTDAGGGGSGSSQGHGEKEDANKEDAKKEEKKEDSNEVSDEAWWGTECVEIGKGRWRGRGHAIQGGLCDKL